MVIVKSCFTMVLAKLLMYIQINAGQWLYLPQQKHPQVQFQFPLGLLGGSNGKRIQKDDSCK